MRFPDDKEKEKENKKINGAECKRKQDNDDIRHCNEELNEICQMSMVERKQKRRFYGIRLIGH